MKKYKLYTLFLFLLVGFVNQATAQQDCLIKLQLAEDRYEEGKIEQIPDLLRGCIETGYNKENKVTALRLLTLTYLYLDKYDLAEESLLEMLKTNPEYEINENVDPIEFIKLYDSFNTDPIFAVGVIGGFTSTYPYLKQTYSTYDYELAGPNYSEGTVGLSFGLRFTYHINENIDAYFEPKYTNFYYALNEQVSDFNELRVKENLNYLELPLLGSYDFYEHRGFNFYGELGFSFGMLLSGSWDGLRMYLDQELPDIGEAAIDTKGLRNPYLYALTIGAGSTYKLKRGNLQLAIRYSFGFNNVLNTDQRYTNYKDMSTELYFVDNDFSVNNLKLVLTYNREFYLHKKK